MTKDLQQLESFVMILKGEIEKNKTKEEDSKLTRTSSEDFCAICYSEAIDTTFKPCGHRSCSQCIKRHLLNNQNCFFCNAKITDVVADNKLPKME